MTPKQEAVLRELADEGYAIINFTPDELGDAPPKKVEETCLAFGCGIIYELARETSTLWEGEPSE